VFTKKARGVSDSASSQQSTSFRQTVLLGMSLNLAGPLVSPNVMLKTPVAPQPYPRALTGRGETPRTISATVFWKLRGLRVSAG
jgi:hypothetical protein